LRGARASAGPRGSGAYTAWTAGTATDGAEGSASARHRRRGVRLRDTRSPSPPRRFARDSGTVNDPREVLIGLRLGALLAHDGRKRPLAKELDDFHEVGPRETPGICPCISE